MEHIDHADLQQRAVDVVTNLVTLTTEAKIGFPAVEGEGMQWMMLWTHVQEEFSLRYGPYPAGFDEGALRDSGVPNPKSPLAKRAGAAVKEFNNANEKILVKYGKKRHILPMYESGIIRVAPASSYDDPSLNPAIRDNELELTIHPDPSHIKMEVFDQKSGKSKGAIGPSDGRIKTTSDTNYYVYCMSTVLAPRLFIDFDDADCCVVIHEPDAFLVDVAQEIEKQMPGYTVAIDHVNYIDPLNANLGDVRILFSKHFRYSYQKELRIVAVPPENIQNFEPVFLELGPLDHYANVIRL